MAGVLIISRDWASRALLRAQLLQDGCAAAAYKSAQDVAAVLQNGEFPAGLIFTDFSLGAGEEELSELAELARRHSVPVWAMAPHGADSESWAARYGFESVLFRPVSVGEVAERIEKRLG